MRSKPGKSSRSAESYSESAPVQLKAGKRPKISARYGAVQGKGDISKTDQVHAAATHGTSGSSTDLPYMDAIQTSFGGHDISDVKAHTDTKAGEANQEMGSTAFASGNRVAFGGSPDLHTAAHEAAHVVQQRAGVHLKGGVGEAGDSYENHADAVAEKVVAGESAENLLSSVAGAPSHRKGDGVQFRIKDQAVQFIGTPLDQKLPEGAEAPEHGETEGQQRRYSVEQYEEMWEKEQGRKLTGREKSTLARGCIGITATNLSGGGNPPLDNAFSSFGAAHKFMESKNKELNDMRANPETSALADGKHAVLFAKLFWSNQDPDREKRKQPDDDAYQPDDDGKVDMSSYRYRAQPGMVNFDYGFWDDASSSFWHANHSQPGMKVYQSTKEKFAAGYTDFDRIIYCVAIATNYDPGLAAIAHAGGGN